MDVNKLNNNGPSPVAPEVAEVRRPEPPKPKAEKRRIVIEKHDAEKSPDITIRSGKFKSAGYTTRIKGAVVSVPKKVSETKMAIELDTNTESFRMVKKTIEGANRRMIGGNSMFQYSIHDATNQIMIRVIDKETKELLLEIPPEKALDAIAKMWELAGIFIDEKR